MTMHYDVTEPPHALLSAEARALPSEELAAHNDLAEDTLATAAGVDALPNYAPDADKVERMKRYVVRQVNFQVEAGPEAYVVSSVGGGGRSRSFRTRPDGSAPLCDPVALAGVRAIMGGAAGLAQWAVTRSVRRGDDDAANLPERLR